MKINLAYMDLKELKCLLCNRKFKSKCILKRHIQTHDTEMRYHCDICNRYIRTAAVADKHKRHHRLKPGLNCCGVLFNSQIAFTRHQEIWHTEEFVCENCDKSFKHRNDYLKHKTSHMENYKLRYPCKFCERRFAGSQARKHHVDAVHEGKKYLCEHCGKELSSQLHLKEHVRIHTGEKPYACNLCENRFSKLQTLKDHITVHTKEKPYACKLCDKKYTQKGALGLHVRNVHKKESPFSCVICGKGFVNKSALNIHLKQHSVTRD